MFDNTDNTQKSTVDGSAMIRTGYDPTQLTGADQLRSKMHQAMMINPSSCNEKNINAYAKMAGELKAQTVLFKHESKQRLEAARNAFNFRNAQWQHVQGAARLEAQYQASEARNLQGMSETLLQLGVTQEQHSGFSKHLDTAERMMKF
jgi:hypothetical protein